MKSYNDVCQAFDSESVLTASKQELEDYLLAIGRAQIVNVDHQARAREMGETLRQLLAARQSQEMHGEAMRLAKIAFVVALVALLVTAAQLIIALRSCL